jgi:propionyl-CoA carboxylase alpha chain
VAAGEKLAFAQKDVKLDGWAIECRINAEDPSRGFLPSTGRLVKFSPPETSMEASLPVPAEGGVRVDTGVYEGGEIPMQYDSMIAKLIVKGRDRAEAIARMRDALDAFVIRGISHNVGFQSALIGHPRFATVEFNTGFVAENYPQGYQAEGARHDDAAFLLAIAGATHRRLRERAAGIEGQLHGRAVVVGNEFVAVIKDSDGHRHDTAMTVTPENGALDVVVDGRTYAIRFDGPIRDVRVTGTCNGRRFAAQVERKGLDYHVAQGGAQVVARMLSKRAAELMHRMPEKQPPDLSRFLLSPMPGLLVDVAVKVGQQVRAGERLAVIEAMKMENVLVAQRDAVVKKVSADKGDSLSVDQVILEFE